MMVQVRAVLFDFDFTLGDSSRGIIDCVNHALFAVGRPPAHPDDIRRRIGLTLPEILRLLAPSCGPDDQDCFIAAFHRRADEVMAGSTAIYDAAIPCIRRLRAADVRTGIVSTKYRYRIESILRDNRLLDMFDIIVGLEDVPDHKPHPAGLLLALRRMEVSPGTALYVGDHEVDVQAAHGAGVRFLGVLTGMATAEVFRRWGCDCVPDISHLEAWLDQHAPPHVAPSHAGHCARPPSSATSSVRPCPHEGQ
jgi:phosphoglycolate phosphatase